MGSFATESVTGIVAFEVVAATRPVALRFALNLPVDGMPEGRNAAILRTVIRNREGFLRYLLLLLGDLGMGVLPLAGVGGITGKWPPWIGMSAGLPLLEELTRALSRNPDRLREVAQVVERLCKAPDSENLIPPDFLDLWSVFAKVIDEDRT